MATDPNAKPDRTRQEEVAALALLLRSTKKRYDLPSLIRASKIKPRAFRPIRPTNALQSNMAAPHFAIVNAWEAALPDITRAAAYGPGIVASAIESASSRIGPVVLQAKAMIPRAVSLVESFHRAAWISRIKAATKLDVSMMTNVSDVLDVTAATTAWNNALADDINAQIRSKLTAALITGDTDGVDDVIAKAKKRAAGIGSDQTHKASRGMDRERRIAAGVMQFLWLHTEQPHPRDWHLARNGKIFSEGDIPPDDRAGVPPHCKCWEIPLLQ